MRVLAQGEADVHMDRWMDEGSSVGRERTPAAVTG